MNTDYPKISYKVLSGGGTYSFLEVSNDVIASTNHKWIYYGSGYSKLLNRFDYCIQEEITGGYTCTTVSGVNKTINILIYIGNCIY